MVNKLQFEDINQAFSKQFHRNSYHIPDDVGPICVDIGANLGSFIVKHHNKFQTIIALEPVYYTFLQCLANLQKYDIQNAFVHNLGYYHPHRYPEESQFEIIRLRQHSSKLPGNVTSQWGIDVGNDYSSTEYELSLGIDLTTIRRLYEIEQINYLKMDCEGQEQSLLYEDLSIVDYLGIEMHFDFAELQQYIEESFDLISQSSPHEFTYRNKRLCRESS